MKLSTSSIRADLLSLLRKKSSPTPKFVTLGELRLTLKLLNTPRISAEGKLIYAYLFKHRHDKNGVTVPTLSNTLGIPSGQVRLDLKDMENKRHIILITAQPNPDLSEVVYYYNLVDPAKYGMLRIDDE